MVDDKRPSLLFVQEPSCVVVEEWDEESLVAENGRSLVEIVYYKSSREMPVGRREGVSVQCSSSSGGQGSRADPPQGSTNIGLGCREGEIVGSVCRQGGSETS